MMSESQALETLSREDPEAAGDARAALAWLTGDEGLETISLLRLQEFLWYALPVKWPMSTPGRVGVAKALGRLFTLAGLDRYAEVCSSSETEKIITAYSGGHEEGIAAYTEAIEESNAAPPDTELLAWGSVMGPQERAAYDACAAALELAFASGELSVGARGWRTRRLDIVNRWLTGRPTGDLDDAEPGQPQDGSPGTDTWLGRISAERIDAWAHGRPGERSRLARGLIPRLLEPPAVPEAALMVILTSGPTGYDELTKQLTDLHGVEGWAAGGGASAGRAGGGRRGTGLHSTGLASAVRTELYALRHRLWALHLLGTERSFSAPLSLTETGVAAALSALLARALRPRHHLGLG